MKTLLPFGIGVIIAIIAFVTQKQGGSELQVALTYIVAYLFLGGDIILRAIRNILKGNWFDEHFLMTIATIGALFIGEYFEAVMVMLLYKVGEFFQELAMENSRNEIRSLMNLKADSARVIRDGEEIEVTPEEIKVGEIIIVRAGEKVALDGVVVKGHGQMDTSSLTGESLPQNAEVGDEVLSGVVNLSGLVEIEVNKEYGESTVAKIMKLVEDSSKDKAPTEQFITRFSKIYTPIVVGIAAIIALVFPFIFGNGLSAEWLHRALVFLVVSCPCALVISVPLSFFSGIGASSKKGVLVKGGQVIEGLTKIDTAVFDKTGTLTQGLFNISAVHTANGYSENEIIETAWQLERFSNHPIADAFTRAIENRNIEVLEKDVKHYTEKGGHGLTGEVDGSLYHIGNARLMEEENIDYIEATDNIGTIVYVAKDREYMGAVIIADTIREDAKKMVSELKSEGVKNIVMLTGDNQATADHVANELGITEAYGDLLPDEKVKHVEDMRKNGRDVFFLGDGINDAPVLVIADVGGAMGGVGSDAAVEAADMVIMNDEPSKVPVAIQTAKNTLSIAKQNIFFALFIKFIFMFLSATGLYVNMKVAVLADVGMTILLVFNAMRKK